ncbi:MULTISPECIES: NAD(P)H-binding protein [Streptomyces]|uniref:NAD(P)H-binding protein n=1 Tax=Streptomyces TaxID=1883 RepID=UPI002119F755|nr:NAD(P)H-binding protein [Streptomyces hilarionis]MCQ9133815.1 NAD(P)H-binding protein [Streptomyces hilarionis]
MILVTGATGTTGREVLRGLPAGLPVRVMARNPARVQQTAHRAEVVAGDYGDPRSLERALRGVSRAFLLTSRVGGDDDARFLRAARSAGVRHVVKVSAAAVADADAHDLVTRWQRANEELLLSSGMRWTLLRPRAFMSNTLCWAPSIASERVVRALYGTSVNACVDPRDVAAAAVCALTESGHEGRIHTLTGPEPISAVEQTAQLGRLLDRPLRFEELSPDQARARLSGRHPADVVEALLASARRQRAGAKVRVEDTVRRLTGHPARPFTTWAEDHLTAFAAGG